MELGQKAPRTVAGGLRGRAWWVIRRRRTFTLRDLMMCLCDGTEKRPGNNLRTYLKALVKVGILAQEEGRMDDEKPTSNGLIRYTLARDVGGKAPVVRHRYGHVYDPNNGATYPFEQEGVT